MVERFNCYIHTPATRATGREIRQDGEFVLASDYAKLEAENAELRKDRDEWRSACVESDAKLRAYTGADLDAPHTEADDIAYKAVAMLQEQSIGGITIHMAARSIVAFAMANHPANATLDRLREVVRSDDDEWQDWEPGDLMRLASAVHAILYPTPENDNAMD